MVLQENIFGKVIQLIQRQKLDQITEKNLKLIKKFISIKMKAYLVLKKLNI